MSKFNNDFKTRCSKSFVSLHTGSKKRGGAIKIGKKNSKSSFEQKELFDVKFVPLLNKNIEHQT